MLAHYINYISLIYGLIFLVISFIFLMKTRRATSSSLKNIFWAFTAFSIMKAMSILLGLSIIEFSFSHDMLTAVIIRTIAAISSEISNLFIFHFGISILTYKAYLRINYRVFPALLFSIYAILNLSGMIEPQDAEKISRQSFGFSGAFLGSVGYFNLFSNKIKNASGKKKLFSEFILYGIALFVYSLTEGIITNSVFGIQVEFLRFLTAIALLISSFFVVDLLKEDKHYRIEFI